MLRAWRQQGMPVIALTVVLWGASLFIRFAEYRSRGEIIRLYGYSLYGWLPASLREPWRVVSDLSAFAAVLFGVLISLCHIAACYLVARLAIWGYARMRRV